MQIRVRFNGGSDPCTCIVPRQPVCECKCSRRGREKERERERRQIFIGEKSMSIPRVDGNIKFHSESERSSR